MPDRKGKKKVESKSEHIDMNQVRFATFNTALERAETGQLIRDLTTKSNPQAKKIAEIIQRTNPDIIAIQEFDYDSEGTALKLFKSNYLEVSQNGAKPIKFHHAVAFPSNTGLPSGVDFDGNGKTNSPNDAFGFGKHPGHYAFAILSKYPIDQSATRTFQYFLWRDMPENNMPLNTNQKPYYSKEATNIFRLSSKNHVDVSVNVKGKIVHLLVAHPTPPVFDGEEDKNGKRNYDEVRLFADYIGEKEGAKYLYDDNGKEGGLPANADFVIFGDMNADPNDGDSYDTAIDQLLNHPRVNQNVAKGEFVPQSKGGLENSRNKSFLGNQKGKPEHDTSNWGLRVDYVLPSASLSAINSGVYWNSKFDKLEYLTKEKESSDHRLVWVDVVLGE